MMWAKKLVVAAVAAASVTTAHGAGVNASYALNMTASDTDIRYPVAEVSPYGRELFNELLKSLNIRHVDGRPLSTLEYNEAVDGVEDLIQGRWSFDEAFNNKVKHGVLKLLSRMTPEEIEQLFDDVTYDLTLAFLEEENDDKEDGEVARAAVRAKAAPRLSTAAAADYVLVLGVFAGCVAVVAAVVVAVANRQSRAMGAASSTITADVILAEIEDAEKMCQQPSSSLA